MKIIVLEEYLMTQENALHYILSEKKSGCKTEFTLWCQFNKK